MGLSVPEVTKIFLKLQKLGLDIKPDDYTVKDAVKTILEAKNAISAQKKGGA